MPVLRSWTNTSADPVGVARDQVGGVRCESDEASVGRDRRERRYSRRRGHRWTNARQLGRARLAVADEDVGAVGVARDQVRGGRREGDEAPVGRDRRERCCVIALPAARSTLTRGGASFRSRTNTSSQPLVSPGTRLVADEKKATKRPSRRDRRPAPLPRLALLAGGDDADPLGRACLRSRTKTSRFPVGVARDQVGGVRGEGDEAAVGRDRQVAKLLPSLPSAAGETLTRSVVPSFRSRTNTSVVPLVSPGTRLVASEAKATKRPSPRSPGARCCRRPVCRSTTRSPARSCPTSGRAR